MLSHSLFVNTGNILSLSEAKQKASQNSTDELIETLKIVLNDEQSKGDDETIINGKKDTSLQDMDRKDLKITVKVFISSPDVNSLKEALDQAFETLHTDTIESLVIAYKSAESPEDMLSSLKKIWSIIEEYVKVDKLSSVGLSDINTNTFIELFQWADIKPNIVQINLATCCVVPPALQEFTKENDIQLLTHSDPCQILPQEVLENIFGSTAYLYWLIRYQIHLKCRGILSSKGYLLRINKSNVKP
ncbi:PREDICTED: glutamate--cysteine ligase regulatory subunit [Cyphomyrmex costatus]|uniref:GCS light chain n=1 Tax=Cyphomyrmex costatus TaxID=456900 RepID=A0A151IKI6_9HYME|nr:PREDICTED: glutamate--cysteine ligase regulatory subunit [Cyphomyrmex costatus]XP_018393031.1 PREDICTED: glutamate--cysteine ligase regulatory subunit [Cyphomyrmex costatus]KYN04974.1 Glutamate--cysteine ligase regulatory subunit [Cyphomyrmex costatus]